MKDFVLIMRANPSMNSLPTAMDLEERVAWLTEIEKNGLMSQKGGAMPAKPDAVAFVYTDGAVVDGFEKGTEHFIVGYLVIKAENIQKAKNIAQTNPLVKAGGSIEVREILLR